VTSGAFRDVLVAHAARAHVAIAPDHVGQLDAYYQLLRRWNRKINLTALPLDPPSDEALDRLFIEPLAAARSIGPRVADRPTPVWFDLGSGGGSPALPMKIVLPRLVLTMVESRSRKVAFLREAARVLELGGVDVLEARLEALDEPELLAELITVRAVRMDEEFASAVAMLAGDAALLAAFQRGPQPAPLQGFTVELAEELPSASHLHLYRHVPRGT
jgi:16S rRNA (guanine527-N7)-methyltransferase